MGDGFVMKWLKYARQAGRHMDFRGLLLICPAACAEDLLAPGDAKPATMQ